jgi:hypothetical protein
MMELVDLQVMREKKPPENVEIGPNDLSIDLLRAIYRCNHLPLPTRMRAAIAAIQFETPKLAVTAQVTENDIATLLDRRIAHYQRMQVLEAPPNSEPSIIEPIAEPPPTPTPILPSPLSRIYSNRFRRRF